MPVFQAKSLKTALSQVYAQTLLPRTEPASLGTCASQRQPAFRGQRGSPHNSVPPLNPTPSRTCSWHRESHVFIKRRFLRGFGQHGMTHHSNGPQAACTTLMGNAQNGPDAPRSPARQVHIRCRSTSLAPRPSPCARLPCLGSHTSVPALLHVVEGQ